MADAHTRHSTSRDLGLKRISRSRNKVEAKEVKRGKNGLRG